MKRIILLELCLLFLATTFQGDRLTGWVQQTIPRPDLSVRDLQFVDTLTGFTLQSRVNPDSSFISKTTDGGNNWIVTQFPLTYLLSIQFINQNTGFCVGRDSIPINGLIMKTTNKGSNWYKYSIIGGIGSLMDVNFVNNDTGWVCADDPLFGGVFQTINNGVSWQKQMSASNRPSKIFFINRDTGWVIGSSNGNIYKTTNSGENWFSQAFIPSSDIFFASKDSGYVIGGVTNDMMKTTNGGYIWFAANTLSIPQESKLYLFNNITGYAGAGLNKIAATKDGVNWGIQTSPIRNYSIWFVDSLHGWAGYSGIVHTVDGGGTIVGINSMGSEVPIKYTLEQNYPNPFNSSTVIRYQLSVDSKVSIKVYDVQGREVQTLVEKRLSPGEYSVSFNSKDLPSGIYFYTLTIDGKTVAAKKISLIK